MDKYAVRAATASQHYADVMHAMGEAIQRRNDAVTLEARALAADEVVMYWEAARALRHAEQAQHRRCTTPRP